MSYPLESGKLVLLRKKIIEQNLGGRLSVYNVVGGAEFKIEV